MNKFTMEDFLTGDLLVRLEGDDGFKTLVLLRDLEALDIRWITGTNATGFIPTGDYCITLHNLEIGQRIGLLRLDKTADGWFADISDYERLYTPACRFDDLDDILEQTSKDRKKQQ